MIFSLIIRAIFIYLLFTFFRAVWRSYKSIESFKKTVQNNQNPRPSSSGVYEAEYRVVSERDQ
ncbi:MAG: hypothetical protein Fur0010_28790 [Bdellovibrio sp.]